MSNNQDPTANIQDRIRQIIDKAYYLFLHPSGVPYQISQELAENYPHKALVKGSDCAFNVEAFARAGFCTILPSEQIHDQRDTG